MSAAWIDGGNEGCGERLLGVLDNSTLTFGRTHDPADTNPYFISLISTETTGLTVSMQSSISSRQLVEVWWEVEAKLEHSDGYYSVSGTFRNDTHLDKNSFSGSSVKADSDQCSFTRDGFIWKPEVNASTFSGTISGTEAVFSIKGNIPENTNRLISYVIQFNGKWDPTSAGLSLDQPIPTWPKPGTPDTAGEQLQPQVSSILVDTNPRPTVDSSNAAAADDIENSSDGPAKNTKTDIGIGIIAAVTTAVIFVLGFVIIAIFCVIQRRKRQQDGKVYPEIAYIYTRSSGSPADSSEECLKILASCESNLEVREVLVNDYSLPVTNQHQWREL